MDTHSTSMIATRLQRRAHAHRGLRFLADYNRRTTTKKLPGWDVWLPDNR